MSLGHNQTSKVRANGRKGDAQINTPNNGLSQTARVKIEGDGRKALTLSPLQKFQKFMNQKRKSPDQTAKISHIDLSKDSSQFFGLRFQKQKNIFSNSQLNHIKSQQQVDLIREYLNHPITPRQQLQNINQLFAEAVDIKRQKNKSQTKTFQNPVKGQGNSKNPTNKKQKNDHKSKTIEHQKDQNSVPFFLNNVSKALGPLKTYEQINEPLSRNEQNLDANQNMSASMSSRYRLFQLTKIGRVGFGKYARMSGSSQNRNSLLPYSFLSQDQQTQQALQKIRDMVSSKKELSQDMQEALSEIKGNHTQRNNRKNSQGDLDNQFRHLKKYSVVLDRIQTEQMEQDNQKIDQQMNQLPFPINSTSPNKLSSKQETTDINTIQKLNLRKMNKFIPFFAERDNVGNLFSDQKDKNTIKSSVQNNNGRKRSISEVRGSKNRMIQSQQAQSDDHQLKQEVVFQQKFKCKDVFDLEYFDSVIQRQEQTKELKGQLTSQIAQYKSKEPSMQRAITQSLLSQRDSISQQQQTLPKNLTPFSTKQFSKTNLKFNKSDFPFSKKQSEDVKGEQFAFSEMYQPNKKFLLTERTIRRDHFERTNNISNIQYTIDDYKKQYLDNQLDQIQQRKMEVERRIRNSQQSQSNSNQNSPSKQYQDVKPRISTSRESSKQTKMNFIRTLSMNMGKLGGGSECLLSLQKIQGQNREVNTNNQSRSLLKVNSKDMMEDFQTYKNQIEQVQTVKQWEEEFKHNQDQDDNDEQEQFQEERQNINGHNIQGLKSHFPEDVKHTLERLGLRSSQYANQLIQRFSASQSTNSLIQGQKLNNLQSQRNI